MGNRAVIAFESMPEVGIYLHWNGGRESVEAFLAEAKRRQLRGGDYGLARLTQLIGEFFSYSPSLFRPEPDHECSLGVAPLKQLDCNNGDNGLYWISDRFEIVRREYAGEFPLGRASEDERAKFDAIGKFYAKLHRNAVARNKRAIRKSEAEYAARKQQESN